MKLIASLCIVVAILMILILPKKPKCPDCGSKIELEHGTEGGTVLTCEKGHKYVELD
jgi:hypothetical protein